jgi:NAD-dependent deacetylase
VTRTERVLVLTGAGVSAESGIPTFRGAGGYWRNFDARQLATRDGFTANPGLVWDWYRERRAAIRSAQPNAAHVAITRLGSMIPRFLLITQNVDDLHVRATAGGAQLDPSRIVQIHGDIFVSRCERCHYSRRDERDDTAGVPLCPRCGGPLRPGVVWFDEELDATLVHDVERFIGGGTGSTVLVIGTTAQFDYIVDWAARAARGGRLIEVNPEPTPLSELATEVIRAPAAEALPALVDRLTRSR